MKIKESEYHERIRQCNQSARAFYLGETVGLLPDATYDAAIREIKSYEADTGIIAPDSPTQRIGDIVTGRVVLAHKTPMLSLDNAFAELDFSAFIDRVYEDTQSSLYSVEHKYDGLAGSLVYEDGALVSAALRGDGKSGEDITVNARAVNTIPLAIFHVDNDKVVGVTVEVRGEFVLPKAAFERLNEAAIKEGKRGYINPRNAVAGIIRQYDPKIVSNAGVIFKAYELISEDHIPTQEHVLNLLSGYGFSCAEVRLVNGLDACMDAYNEILDKRHYLPYEIDGVVFKLNDRLAAKRVGSTAQFPKTSIAFKFPPEEVLSRLNDVELQVGRTGVITPVAKIDPVFVGGVTVSSVTLHNFDEIARLGLHLDAQIYVRRAGDVIPQITGIYDNGGAKIFKVIQAPKNCPVCNGKVGKVNEDHSKLYCLNGSECPPQVINGILHAVSRSALNIDGIGDSIATKMVQSDLVKWLPDLFRLPSEDPVTVMAKLEIGQKVYNKLMGEITRCCNGIDFNRLLLAFGIPGVGEVAALNLSRAFKDINSFLETGKDPSTMVALKIDEIGTGTAHAIATWIFQNYSMVKYLQRFVNVTYPAINKPLSQTPLNGFNIVITGSFGDLKRDDIKNHLRELGANVQSSVSKTTNLLLCGENAGSKRTDAEKLDIPVVTSYGKISLADLEAIVLCDNDF